ncbi:MAG: NAD-dependent epimerase/dehydratase family protein [Christensenellales bacterium]
MKMSKPADVLSKCAESIVKNTDLRPLHHKKLLLTNASNPVGLLMLACLQAARPGIQPELATAVTNGDPPPYVQELAAKAGVHFLIGDMADAAFCDTLPEADYIIHGLDGGESTLQAENPLHALHVNTSATCCLLGKLQSGGSFLFVSSDEVYTGLIRPPHREDQIGTVNTNHPRAGYIEGKRCGEAIVHAHRENGADAKCARLSLTYGPGAPLDGSGAVAAFIQKGFEGKIALADYGKITRAYLYATDAAELLWKILFFGKQGIYNVGGITRRTSGDLAQVVGAVMNVPVIFPYYPREVPAGPKESYLDMSKAEQEFCKTNYIPLKEGITQTVEWYSALREPDK